MRRVSTRVEFSSFLEALTSSERPPVVAVSIAEGQSSPAFPTGRLHDELGDAADIWELEPQATFWLTDELGKRLSVYSGWVRVYPATQDWRTDERRAPLVPARVHRDRWVRTVVDKVFEAAYADGFRPQPAPAGATRAVAVVDGPLNSTQVLVRIDRGQQATLRTHHLWPGIPAERLVAPGQRFAGSLVPGGLLAEFVPDPPAQDLAARVGDYVGDGIVTLAKVARVLDDKAELLVHPEVAVTVEDDGGGLAGVLRLDEVVAVEVVPVDGTLVASFCAEEAASSMSVLPGGPPWLEWQAPLEPAADGASPGPDGPEPDPTGDADGDGDDNDDGEAWLYQQEIDRLEARLRQVEEENRVLRRTQRELRRLSVPTVYADPRDQLRLELHLSYLARVPESDRSRYPWPDRYRINRSFVDSMEEQVRAGGVAREKIVDVCAEVLCGLAADNHSRAVKEWLDGRHGRPVVRDDGAACMRVRIQHKSSSARRLRFWRLPTGEIELDWVGVHDAGLG